MKRILAYPIWLTFSVFQKTENSSCIFKDMQTRLKTKIKEISFYEIISRKRIFSFCRSYSLISYIEYFFSAVICIFCLSILPCIGFIKIFIVLLYVLLLIFPITRMFFRPFLPIVSWLILFYACRFIPSSMRPHIWISILPTLENILYGVRLSSLLSNHTHFFLDILAWIPYGIIHFGAPFITAIVIYLSSPPGTLPVFAKCFGYLNLIGVIIQLVFPCSPPWYESLYGSQLANYSMGGSAGGLARIDSFFGTKVYTSIFPASPLVFGAFPSLHSGHATLEALFLSCIFPKTTPYFVIYVLWLWWCTMYLTHHYFIDLIGGSCLAVFIFYIANYNYSSHIYSRNLFRWDYHNVIYDSSKTDPEVSKLSFARYNLLQDSKMNRISHDNHKHSFNMSPESLYTNKLSEGSLFSIWDKEAVGYINTLSSFDDVENYGNIGIVIK
ncbi:hypothetical protein T552_02251 [Pneumocystis carinii B80]|uniref:Phosphatidic acid phosphatase type 2/haloperoxidase domain-containing protein n=2 Tax=Pneumocystis carinii TaxID=4754 RepID=A0A0W4ZFW1_PNEC8|nr:hypothetical protein T552_02251 [Pneumocystis carinii B80]KTW27268.1 hypothetical protein T552_02251 [Pneumocystis carinii B80]CAH17867.1 inositol phosphorylceramide synthase (Aur1), putative [Pneumocystis carinii]